MGAEACRQQIAEAGEAEHGVALTAEVSDDLAHLLEADGGEEGLRVGAEMEAVGDAEGDGVDVLERGAQFEAGDVQCRLDLEVVVLEDGLTGAAFVLAGKADDDRHRLAARHLGGDRRAAHAADESAAAVRELGADHFAHAAVAARLETLGDVEHELIRPDDAGEIGGDGAHDLRRHADDDKVRAFDGGAHLPDGFHPVV